MQRQPLFFRLSVRCGKSVDFMPTTDVAIGFENKWYPDGYKNAIKYSIDENETIKILAPEHFLATKTRSIQKSRIF